MHRRDLPLSRLRGERARAWLAVVVACAGLSLAAPEAAAQAPEETAGQRLFREGREAIERGEVDLACSRFEESHRLEGAVGPLLNLANCDEKRGRTARALESWQRALTLLRPDQEDQRKLAQERVAVLDRRVPHLRLKAAPLAPPGMTVLLDGAAIAADGSVRRVDPGAHRLEIGAPGRTTTTREIRLNEQDNLELTVEPGPPPATRTEAEEPVAPVTPGGSPLLVGGLVASGVGVLGLGLFAVTGVLALDASSDLEAACGADNLCPRGDSEGREAAERGEGLLVPNAIGLGVGAVGLGLGATLLVLHAMRDGEATSLLLPAAHAGGGAFVARF